VRSSLELVLKRAGYEAASVSGPKAALDFIRRQTPQLILMDMNYTCGTSGDEGLLLLKQTRALCPEAPVILITAWGSINLAVKGIQAGAFDFVTKPWHNLSLLNSIQTALELNRRPQAEPPGNAAEEAFYSTRIVGRSPLLKNIFSTVSRIAPTHASVLITGESGTGKELIAEAIHQRSPRRKQPFVKVNLGGISHSLFESEMFGHRKGAFTDALYDRAGRFEMADKGSIFLDEIGDLDAACQVKLLRVLQDRTFEPLGDSHTRHADVRIISATNKNLRERVATGAFREDLFYRINLITLHVPALRERPEDIPLLVDHFVKKQEESNGLKPVEVSPDALSFLQSLPWPGNIRELKNLVERTLLVSGKTRITCNDFQAQYTEPLPGPGSAEAILPLDEMEKQMILKALSRYGNNLSRVAPALGLTRQALYRRLEKYGIAYSRE
jgi:DNA-binding NtrC family response regulator